jgi:CO/xanthine dehydrogenase Mo-binding subunit
MGDFKFIGKHARRVDALEKVLGTAKFLGDLSFSNMLYARALRSDLPHALIKKLDTSPALKIPGVVAVITSDDYVDNGNFGFPVKDAYALAYKKVRYVGDAIAAVAAESVEAAIKGINAIICELEPLPILTDMDHALDPDAPQVGPDRTDGKSPNFLDLSIVRKDSPYELFDKCDVKIDHVYKVPPQEHAYMETEGALAIPTPGGGVTVYASNQSPWVNHGHLVTTLGLPPHLVRVIQPPVGGSFGGKDDLNYQSSCQVAKLALITGRPVRMTFSREESMIASYKRDAMNMHIQLGADEKGTLQACIFNGTLDSGAYSSESSFTGWRASIHAMGAYRYNAVHVDITSVYTNNGYAGAFRGFGNTEACSAIERAIDEMAEKVNIDPIDFRLKNCLRLGDEAPYGQKLTESVGLEECIRQVRHNSDWDRKRAEYTKYNKNSKIKKGIGVAVMFHGTSLGAEGLDEAHGNIWIENDNTVVLTSALTDYGQGSRTVYTLIAAEELGIPPHKIQMLRPDTNTALDSGPTVASRSTILGGNALRHAVRNLNQTLNFAAADLLHCEESQLVREGELFIGPTEEPVKWDAVVDHARDMGLSLSEKSTWRSPDIHWDASTGRGIPYFAYHFAAHVAEVEVEAGTGQTAVVDYWAAHDAGKVIFPEGASGQVYGGIAQGIGYALLEDVIYDKGYLQTVNFDEYLIPTALDVPDINAVFVETTNSVGPYGAKNIAEPSLVPSSPAILNAIAHATGKRIYDLPANLEHVLIGHALKKEGSTIACRIGLLTH